MKNLIFSLATLLVAGCHELTDDGFRTDAQPPTFPDKEWVKVANPETYGWSTSRLNEARQYAGSIKSETVMVIDEGRLMAAWGNTDKKYYVASVRKSLLSVLYGFYVNQSISLSATLGEYGIQDKNPPLNAPELKATVKDLLTASSGVCHKAAAADNNDELPLRNSAQPGSTFFYNNWDFNALGTIFEKRTRAKIYEVFNQRIAQPIGMQDFNWQQDGHYDYSDYSEHPAYHFDMTARDMARFGLLVMNKGQWKGQQLVPADWLAQSTAPQIVVPESEGGGSYGYMWWVHDSGKLAEAGLSKQAFSAQGTWSQLILVDPTRRLVIVHRGYNRTISGDKILSLLKKIIAAKQ
ncbi:serine hydrolase domain-containing protein [Spirosoma sordidisoli]|uniref:Class C beta-lactamase-related serine hydrolase n=1 Tax=Spirosoma sordidisoli TaxID=2502893 RepID=A0A4Q2UCK4_9BACT|nr:serine hydrolase [Spirosoma sordidisoli]RYC66584.1 class C beta-lactamase-related serine hydrolase [Spirosoma sordidisoli]